MKRRVFVASGLITAAGVIGWRFQSGSSIDAIELIVRKNLGYLQLDAAGVRAFAQDLANKAGISSDRLRMVAALAPMYSRLSSSTTNRSMLRGVRHGEERIVTTYLLSSDFFVNGANINRIVRYLGYYDPLFACGNPFARRVTY